jgi:hypothetical protein
LPCLALLLIPSLAIESAWSRQLATAQRVLAVQTPYLVAIGSPPMRFLAPAPPRDLVSHPPAGAPPQPQLAAPTRPDFIPADPPATVEPAIAEQPSGNPADAGSEDSAPAKRVLPILVDELRPRVRAEDFLPYFQIPAGQEGDPNLLIPIPRSSTPAALPTSSATYTQSPR